jgi:hypothetical protein
VTGPYLFAAIAFIAGIAVGWVLATARAKASTSDFTSPLMTGSAAGTGRSARVKARTMEMKCACGSLSKFRDPVEPGYLPFPDGDSIACPNCGRVTKLKEIRKLAGDAQG